VSKFPKHNYESRIAELGIFKESWLLLCLTGRDIICDIVRLYRCTWNQKHNSVFLFGQLAILSSTSLIHTSSVCCT